MQAKNSKTGQTVDEGGNSLLSFSELVFWSQVRWALLLICVAGGRPALAQTTSPSSASAASASAASASAAGSLKVPDGRAGLPGLFRVGVPATTAPRWGSSLWANYGYTEPQNDETEPHHRVGGSLAIGGAFMRYVAGAVRVDYRHDLHGADASGESDSGSVLDVTPLLRAGVPVGKHWLLGTEAMLHFSGAARTSGVATPAVDGRLLASYWTKNGFIVSGYAGMRSAHTGRGVEEAALLRPGDRVALGLSESPAVLVGLGAAQTFGRTTLLLEGTFDLLLGSDAPKAAHSPLLLGVGVRQTLRDGLHVHAMVEVAPNGRAASTVDDPLVPIEPRVSGILGISVRFPDIKPSRRPDHPKQEVEPLEQPVDTPAQPAETAAPLGGLRVVVVDETGHPISDARVRLILPATKDGQTERELAVPLRELNRYELSEVPLGEAEVTIEAELLEGQRRSIEVSESTVIEVKLKKATGVGSQLRGLVRDYSGQGLQADIHVEPGGHATKCDKNGEFVLDLPEGTYSVTIEAEGHATQKRRLRIRREGVTVLNADLQQKN